MAPVEFFRFFNAGILVDETISQDIFKQFSVDLNIYVYSIMIFDSLISSLW